jgi:hypothetical protein
MVTFGSVLEKKAYALIEQGEYVLTLSELEESEGQYGDRVVWKWLVAPLNDYTAYFCRDDGQEKTLWAFTDPDIVMGSLAHQFAEALTGRKLGKDSAPPTEDELVGHRLIAYITHETPKTGKSAGIKREKIVDGSIKPFREPGRKAATQVTADPSDEDVDRALLVTKLEKQVARLEKLDKASGKKAREALEASDLETAPLADIQQLSDAVGESITAALDA